MKILKKNNNSDTTKFGQRKMNFKAIINKISLYKMINNNHNK